MDLTSTFVGACAGGWVDLDSLIFHKQKEKKLDQYVRDLVKVSKLLASESDLVNCESGGRTPLLAAVHHRRQEVSEDLLKRHFFPDASYTILNCWPN